MAKDMVCTLATSNKSSNSKKVARWVWMEGPLKE